jgi:dihydroorotate dehydrogenase (fumarate)
LENLKTAARLGAGAVILKSVFEEQIKFETDQLIDSENKDIKTWKDTFADIVSDKEFYYDEAYSYLTSYAKEHTLKQYLEFISEAKKTIEIPVIASINCTSQHDWQYFAKRIQDAGADALELNVFLLPSDFNKKGTENEQVYFDVIKEVKKYVTIPVALKTGYYFSSLAKTLIELSETGIAGMTLFNRPYNPDIDIDELEVSSSNIFSSDNEYTNTLRWVALLSGRVKCDIAASTGIHNHQTVIKQLLAGADAVQMASVFYKHHFDVLPEIIRGLETWMTLHNFSKISDFKGLLAQKNIANPASYERVQFLRLFSSIE